jgi:predicted nucleic acid-binding Zn ribbon protein
MSIANPVQLICPCCGKEVEARTNQKHCSETCRIRFNNRKTSANRKLAELVNPRAIACAKNVNLLRQLILDNQLGPHTLKELESFGYCPKSPHDDSISYAEYQVTIYGNVRLKKYIGEDRYELSVERWEKKMRRRASYATKG